VPWKVTARMDLKREFVRRHGTGERMTDLCREFSISRETGYALVRRYKVEGAAGLAPRSRAPLHSPRRTPEPLVDLVVAERRAHPSWGARKLKVVLEQREGVKLPSPSALTEHLKRRGLIEPRRRRARVPPRTRGLHTATAPNDVWCVDYKGQFRLGDGSHCYPLTLTDQYSRFLLACEGMSAIDSEAAWEASAHAFRRYGVPHVMRSDNGAPFATARSLAGLTSLAAMWMRLGIELERIDPGHPEQNGRHERMHRTLKQDTTRPASANLLAQQERFDSFVEEFNQVRPHEACGDRPPASVYRSSDKSFTGSLLEPSYPLHDDVLVVTRCGHIYLGSRRKVFLTCALADHPVGVREQDDGRWCVTFMNLDLGHYDPRDGSFTPIAVDGPGSC
jgi:transposase InsO family protein